MKNLKTIFLSLALMATTAAISSCGSTTSTEKTGKEYTAAYVCPMHCDGSGGDAAGTCPACKMDYVKNEDHNADGHSH